MSDMRLAWYLADAILKASGDMDSRVLSSLAAVIFRALNRRERGDG